jgi:hypothetical protein
MDHSELLAHLDKRFDRVEEKLDSQGQRVTKLEADYSWIRGGLKYISVLVLGIVGKLTQITFFRS